MVLRRTDTNCPECGRFIAVLQPRQTASGLQAASKPAT